MNSILKAYIPIANLIVKTFGKNCEVVLHDLTQPQNSVVYAANGEVTGRKVGQSFDHLIKMVLLNKDFKDDYVVNYFFETHDGKKIKSSSALIRNEKDEVIGMLCLNYDLTLSHLLQEELQGFLGNTSSTEDMKKQEEYILDQDIMSTLDNIIEQIFKNTVKNNEKLTRKKSLEIIKFMDEKGIFLVKGSIDKVANFMGVSKVTVYSYLDAIKGKR
ncbi:DNA-binding protein [Malaciobacter molluscorum LMG 25693]|uniref:DNA-binding protein n=1 Tax=Malaciobacter molluscorum LMG 25693 TaxID=870501 RepID=A0A2G1DKM8_9BACT|nr:helix-turn-helix transcriptional regulator [Malaciobacter molluscorum]AXX92538.1 PAS domain-containing transcriptional regulator, YheO family [Malaciobacter molluscorum LMG 25693]PHO18964.1 DNA-binding protein [Malaciobacter molluscorum LMG 25693]RXJ97268.1 DNA-binding protein [Malaciobacter molluscorum]